MSMWGFGGQGFGGGSMGLNMRNARKAVNQGIGENQGYYLQDPEYLAQQRQLGGQMNRDIGRLDQGLIAQGYSPEEAARKNVGARIGAWGEMGNLYGQQAGIVKQEKAERKARKRNAFGNFLGTVLGLGSTFGGMKYQSVLDRNAGFGGSESGWKSRASNLNAWGG